MLIYDIIDEVMQSDDMKKYLHDNIILLKPRMINDMIVHAPISLSQKYEIMKLLTDTYDEECYNKSFKFLSSALYELNNHKSGRVYEVYYCYSDEDNNVNESGSELFKSFDNAMRYIKNDIIYVDNNTWTILTMWDEIDGELTETFSYCFIDNNFYFACDEYIEAWMSGEVNLPIPFKPGDKIITNGYPFTKESEAIIIDIGDNYDCCSIIIELADGETGPLKHSFAFRWDIVSSISPLYRIRKMN